MVGRNAALAVIVAAALAGCIAEDPAPTESVSEEDFEPFKRHKGMGATTGYGVGCVPVDGDLLAGKPCVTFVVEPIVVTCDPPQMFMPLMPLGGEWMPTIDLRGEFDETPELADLEARWTNRTAYLACQANVNWTAVATGVVPATVEVRAWGADSADSFEARESCSYGVQEECSVTGNQRVAWAFDGPDEEAGVRFAWEAGLVWNGQLESPSGVSLDFDIRFRT